MIKKGFYQKEKGKRKWRLWSLLIPLLATNILFYTGCKEDKDPNDGNRTTIIDPDDNSTPSDNPNVSVSDPEGTIQVTMRNANNGTTHVLPDNCYDNFYIGGDDNFYGTQRYGTNFKFATVGKVNGLGNITKIPTSGWANPIAIVPGYGYVGASYDADSDFPSKARGVTYVRIYVIDWVVSTSGGIIGAEVKYQSPFPFKPDVKEITLSETSINLPASGTNGTNHWFNFPTTIVTVSPSNANWSVTSSDDSWCLVWTNNINSFGISYMRNYSTPRTTTLTVRVEGLPDKTITVTQQGGDGY